MADPLLFQLVFLSLATSPAGVMDDQTLAAEIKNGSHTAFRSFFEAHHRSLYRFLRSKQIDKQTAEDLIQKAFIYIWEHRSSIDPAKSLRAYLFRIAYTRMLNYIRDNSKFDRSQAVPRQQADENPEHAARLQELHRAIDDAIAEMPEKRGRVFELCFIEQFTYREAAGALDVSVKTVENHMGLALKDMRKALSDYL